MSAGLDKPRWELSDTSSETYLDIRPTMFCDDFVTIHKLLLSGMGISLLPDYLCTSDEDEQRLVRVLDNWVGRTVNIYGIYPSRKGVAPKMRVFLDYLSQCL